MRKFEVYVKQAGSLMAALRRELPLLPDTAFREALKRRDIKVNSARAGENIQVRAGDRVELYTPHEAGIIPVLFEDEVCLLVNKPAGLNTDDNHQSGASLLSWARERAAGAYEPLAVHRLDNPTSGLLLLAKGERAFQELAGLFRRREVVKGYECLVKGCPEPREAVKSAWLAKDASAARVRVYGQERPGAREIITGYKVVEVGEISRLKVVLYTGRTHQIRAHLAYLGHPLLGDEAYGDRGFNREHRSRQLALCATRLAFPGDAGPEGLRGRVFQVEAPF